ncbi:MAG: thiamine pyrophosphate-binding protein [Xanthobacteraceae bacterium]|nr:thiamine pyrophosphate-binding protein [Xanthobacteraceae bacterium]
MGADVDVVGDKDAAADDLGTLPERPVPQLSRNVEYGSDAVADVLRQLDLPFIAINPGASFRGLHDSLVNHLGNTRPRLLLCLHEEHAVAIAHGFAKVTGRPMAAVVHANVGLMHASMAIDNAWCDRAPILVLGATGPVDAAQRRPWIDWIHTSADQGALVRNYVKWDNQPASIPAAREALFRAAQIAATAPAGPVYVNLDATLQESRLDHPLAQADAGRFAVPLPSDPNPALVARAVSLIGRARRPVIMAGRVTRSVDGWNQRITLAETIKSRVLTDLKSAAAFPTDHPLHASAPGLFPRPEALAVIRDADLIIALDWTDLGGTLAAAYGRAWPDVPVIHASLDPLSHNGWSMDHQALPAVDVNFLNDPDVVVARLLQVLTPDAGRPTPPMRPSAGAAQAPKKNAALDVRRLGLALREACGSRDVCLARLPLSWEGDVWPFRHPLDYLGYDGGGGIGSGPGMAVGAALALRGSGRLAVAILGDGDFLMGLTAIWTAVHYKIPLLVVVANNRSFFNDEMHQDRVAGERGRPRDNRWIGQRMVDPELQIAKLADGQGAKAFGPVTEAATLPSVFRDAIASVDAGGVAVVDVRVEPDVTLAMPAAVARSGR